MKKHPVDELFSRKLRDAEITPRDEAFQKFQQRLQTKERRIGWWQQGPWLAAAGVSLLLMAGGGWWLMSQQPSESDTVALSKTPSPKIVAPNPPQNGEQKAVIAPSTNELASLDKKAKAGSRSESQVPTFSSATAPTSSKSNLKTKEVVQPLVQETQVAQVVETTPASEPVKQMKLEEPSKTVALASAITAKPTEKTVVLQLPELEKTLVAANDPQTNVAATNSSITDNDVLDKPRKSTRMAKVWQQLKNAKNGEKVDWDEVGFHPNKVVAKAIGK
ncbi:hypothetical protein FHS57_005300 [Runella defluvii]|uniref:Uncharacterized protein n=1 Tax=Runella defluvii TaxID=370973 RepID=A0A7W5ZPK8_9BACT|nr:hypothetical protein [Runella defluvii]MBB3841278.1 hypothetical protein [Runella defluvii]